MKPLLELDCAAILRYMSFASSSEMALSAGVPPVRLSVVKESSKSWLLSSHLREAVAYYFPMKIILLTCHKERQANLITSQATTIGGADGCLVSREGRPCKKCVTLTQLDVEELPLKFYLRATSTGRISSRFVIC